MSNSYFLNEFLHPFKLLAYYFKVQVLYWKM